MATSDLPLVLEAVGLLDQELTRLTRQAHALIGPLSPTDQATTIVNLRTVLDRAKRAIRSMRDRVLDSATELTVDRFESAFRARTIVLQIQLQNLKHAEPEVAHRLWPAPGRFQSVDEVNAFLLDRIGRVNAHWTESRHALGDAGVEPDHRALIGAVANAELELISVGKDRDVISFLAVGASLTSEDFRTACRVIAALLDVALAPLATITVRAIRAPSLAHRLAPHTTRFATAITEEDLDD